MGKTPQPMARQTDWSARSSTAWSLLIVLLLAACSSAAPPPPPYKGDYSRSIGRPYQINGVWYQPRYEPNYDQVGIASWYGSRFHGRQTASGQIYNMYEMTAAHTTLPLGTRVHVTNLENGRSLELLINDRGPFVGGRIIDVSKRAAKELGFQRAGTARVRVQIAENVPAPAARPQPAAVAVQQAARGASTTVATQQAAIPRVTAPRASGQDARFYQSALNSAMEWGTRESLVAWGNPRTGVRGVITPLTTPTAAGAPRCRNYRRTAQRGQQQAVYLGRACRAPDGSWRVVRERLSQGAPTT